MESQREQYVRTRAEAYRLRAEVERLQAEIASKDRLLPSLLAEGAATERARAEKAEARAERAEALVAGMLEAFQWAMRHVENVFALAGRHDRERPQLEAARAAIAKATGAKP